MADVCRPPFLCVVEVTNISGSQWGLDVIRGSVCCVEGVSFEQTVVAT